MKRPSSPVGWLAIGFVLASTLGLRAADPVKLELQPKDRICFVGDTIAERLSQFGYLEALLQTRFNKLQLTVRDLSWSCDTPTEQPRPLNFGETPGHLTEQKADVIFLFFGMTASFKGDAGLDEFEKGYNTLVKSYLAMKFNGKSAPRLVVVSPIAHEKLGGHLPDPTAHNKDLEKYTAVARKVAELNHLPFVDLFTPTSKLMAGNDGDRFTFNGIHQTEYGDWCIAQLFINQLFERQQVIKESPNEKFSYTIPTSLPIAPPANAKVHSGMLAFTPHIMPKGNVTAAFTAKINGEAVVVVRPTDSGKLLNMVAGPCVMTGEKIRWAVQDKNEQFYLRFRAVNGEYIYGRRKAPFGVVNFPGEMQKLDEITASADQKIHGLLLPPTLGTFEATPGEMKVSRPARSLAEVKPDEVLYKQTPGTVNAKVLPTASDLDAAKKSFKLSDGYEINLFASEHDFPIHNPVAMEFDSKGRAWVGTNPSYPHSIPGEAPNDKILILEDTNGDGKADKYTVFADHLYMPLGFEFGDGGVYVSGQPTLLFLKDTDGDDKADVRETILHGLGTGDSHHAVHAFHWGPDGGLYFGDGTFHRTNVETPHGPLRLFDAGWIRFDPKTYKTSAFVSYPFANPWGQVFDRFGQNFIADASGGSNYFGLPITGHVDHPRKHPPMKTFTATVRPTCGCELVYSRQFPDDIQGDFLVNNCIGFQGIKRHKVIESESGFTSQEMPPLLQSSDVNFRPVDINFGPDGALYIVDWFNPLIGHMQFSIRDPGRDHIHGRIWRITAKGRPLVTPAKIAGQPVADLLELFRAYEDRTRYRARREIVQRPTEEVIAALKTWVTKLDPNDKETDRMMLEALWVYQSLNVIEPELLKTLLRSKDYHIRAGATRVLRFWSDRLDNSLALLKVQANDENPRVRLEAVIACSFFTVAEAAEVALEALKYPTDYYLDYGIKETMTTLEPYWKPHVAAGKPFSTNNPAGANYVLAGVTSTDLVKMPRSSPVYVALLNREGVLPEIRKEALVGLAKMNKTTVNEELFAAIYRLDVHAHHNAHGGHVIHDLAQLLISQSKEELAKVRDDLEQLATCGKTPTARQIGYVGWATADGSIDGIWKEGLTKLERLRDVLEALPLIPDPKLRASAWSKVSPLLTSIPAELLTGQNDKKGVKGRFVRILLPGGGQTLSLAEVQVFSDGVNVALKGKATQNSTSNGGEAKRAIDGNTDGVFARGSITHSNERDLQPWWEVDLGKEVPIESIVVWNRTDMELGKRLNGFTLTVLDANRKEAFAKPGNSAPTVNAKFALSDDPVRALRRAAFNAVTSLPGHDVEVFTTLAGFVEKNDERDAAIRALRRVPRTAWPKERIKPLLEAVVNYVEKLPAEERTEAAGIDAFQLGSDLASMLPINEAKPFRAKLGDLGVQVVLVRTVPHKMAYDRTKIYVEAGKPVVLVLENPDIMPHNLVIVTPNAMAEIGIAAEAIALTPDGQARQYVPNSPKVLHPSRLLSPGETQRMSFTAPTVVGDYPFLCTFPGHWRVMNGTLKVVPKLSDIPPSELNPPPTESEGPGRAFVRSWTVDDLVNDLGQLDKGRDFAKGKALFRDVTCIKCHKVGTEGGQLGPDMGEVFTKLKDKKIQRLDILKSMVHPSEVIDEKFRTVTIETKKGEIVSGMVVFRDAKVIRVQAGPDAKLIELALGDIEESTESKISMMPEGLLVTLNKEEILDLLAYVVHGMNESNPAFRK